MIIGKCSYKLKERKLNNMLLDETNDYKISKFTRSLTFAQHFACNYTTEAQL